jgi:Asp-tRNA(Asn)/Glu-tRNA(Gln) amidotransferase A subunit family amidase
MPPELCWLSAMEIVQAVRARQISPLELVDALLAQIDRVNPRVNAVVTRCDDLARRQARAVEQAILRGENPGPLAGVPLTVKDLHLTAGIRTTLGSKLYEDFVPDWDQPIVARLKRAGAIILGKTNTSEFGLIPLATNSIFGDSINPWKAGHNTGGSSGGAAAAVVCGMGPLATASDGGGSIRVPAAFCGAFGMKPQFGRIGHVAFPRGWETLAHQGIITRGVRDSALALDVLAGPHPADRQSLPPPSASFLAACGAPVQGLRLAWCARLGNLPVEPDVAEIGQKAARKFEQLGCHVDEVEMDLPDLGPLHQRIVLCEAATANQPRREQWQRVLFPANRKIFEQAESLTFRDLIRAHWTRDEYSERIAPVFEKYDALLTPVAAITAPLNGTLGPKQLGGQPQRSLFWLGHCVPFNMTGQPAASLPVGFSASGLPVGLQLVGRRHDEATLFRLAAAFEEAFPWQAQRPPVCAT